MGDSAEDRLDEFESLWQANERADPYVRLGPALTAYVVRRGRQLPSTGYMAGYSRMLREVQAASTAKQPTSDRRQVRAFRAEVEGAIFMWRAQAAWYAVHDRTDPTYVMVLDMLISGERFLDELETASEADNARLVWLLEAERRELCARRRAAYRRWERGEADVEDDAAIAKAATHTGRTTRDTAEVYYGTGRYLPALRGRRPVVQPGRARPRPRGAGRPRGRRRRTVRSSARSGDSGGGGGDSGEGEPAGHDGRAGDAPHRTRCHPITGVRP